MEADADPIFNIPQSGSKINGQNSGTSGNHFDPLTAHMNMASEMEDLPKKRNWGSSELEMAMLILEQKQGLKGIIDFAELPGWNASGEKRFRIAAYGYKGKKWT